MAAPRLTISEDGFDGRVEASQHVQGQPPQQRHAIDDEPLSHRGVIGYGPFPGWLRHSAYDVRCTCGHFEEGIRSMARAEERLGRHLASHRHPSRRDAWR